MSEGTKTLATEAPPPKPPSGRWTAWLNRAIVLVASAAGVLLALATAAGFFGGIWWVTDLLANLRVHYALGFLVLGAVFAVARPRALALVCLFGALANGALVAPLYLERPAPPAEGAEVLRIMFLNTEIREADADAMIEDLTEGHPDLVVLSAVTDRWAEVLGEADIPYTVAQARPRGTSLEFVVLAREGLEVDTAVHQFGERGRDLAVEARVSLDGTPVLVLGIHPVSPATSARAERQARQLSAIATWARAQPDPVVVVGDLNVTPWGPGFGDLLWNGQLVNSQSGFGIQASWPVWLGPLGIPIDHALHSRELTTVERSLGPGYGSDHRSLHVAVALTGLDR